MEEDSGDVKLKRQHVDDLQKDEGDSEFSCTAEHDDESGNNDED